MIFDETRIPGVYRIRFNRVVDARGYFARGWCGEEFRSHGLNAAMIQLNLGSTRRRGTIRGLHYQLAPNAEAKFVRCTRGAVHDVAVDLRPDSPTFLRWHASELTADNDTMLYIPEGCAHGYQTLTDDAEIYYLTSAVYSPGAARGVRYDDPAFNITWPHVVSVISEADASWPDFAAHDAATAPKSPRPHGTPIATLPNQ